MKDLSSKLDRLIRSSKEMTKEVKGINSTFKECDSRLDVVQEKVGGEKLLRGLDRKFATPNVKKGLALFVSNSLTSSVIFQQYHQPIYLQAR